MPVTHWKKRNGTLKGGNGVKRCWMWTCELRCPLVDKSSTHRPLWGAALACPGADLHPPTADPSWWEGLWRRDAQRHKHSLNLNRRFLNLFCVCVCVPKWQPVWQSLINTGPDFVFSNHTTQLVRPQLKWRQRRRRCPWLPSYQH